MLYYLLLFGIAVLPVVLLIIYIYRQDKYQKEPAKSLIKAFIGGMIAIPLDILLVTIIDFVIGNTVFAETVFFQAFLEAGIPEELCKFVIFMIFIWNDKNFDEYFDGIVYAVFIGLGFACVENISYVFSYGFGTGIVRALLSVPAHFLFGVVIGYFLSLAKFQPEKRGKYLWTGLLLVMLAHGLFDWLLMVSNVMPVVGGVIYIIFLAGDIALWRLGLKYINKMQENSRIQAEETMAANLEYQTNRTDTSRNSVNTGIDWNADD